MGRFAKSTVQEGPIFLWVVTDSENPSERTVHGSEAEADFDLRKRKRRAANVFKVENRNSRWMVTWRGIDIKLHCGEREAYEAIEDVGSEYLSYYGNKIGVRSRDRDRS